MFRDGDLRQKRLCRPASLQQVRRCLRLHHPRAPLGAGVFRADGDDNLIACWDVIQPLAPVLADLDHVATAARADDAVWLNHMLYARQALRQCAGFACLARSLLLRVGLAGCQSFFNGLDLGLRFGDGRLQIFQRQFQLRGVQLLGFRPKLGAQIILNLASSF